LAARGHEIFLLELDESMLRHPGDGMKPVQTKASVMWHEMVPLYVAGAPRAGPAMAALSAAAAMAETMVFFDTSLLPLAVVHARDRLLDRATLRAPTSNADRYSCVAPRLPRPATDR
jgi:hypothetical protein